MLKFFKLTASAVLALFSLLALGLGINLVANDRYHMNCQTKDDAAYTLVGLGIVHPVAGMMGANGEFVLILSNEANDKAALTIEIRDYVCILLSPFPGSEHGR